MTREEKLAVINGLAEQLNQYPHFYITNIEALNAEQTASLRRKCFENNIKLVVVKNTLFGKALEKVEKAEAELVGVLEGSTSIMFAETGKAPAVVIKEFRKSCDKPVLKAAYDLRNSLITTAGAFPVSANITDVEPSNTFTNSASAFSTFSNALPNKVFFTTTNLMLFSKHLRRNFAVCSAFKASMLVI